MEINIIEDKELLRRMEQDDPDAFEIIYNRYWLGLYDNAHQRLKNTKQAEDIVQDVFLRLWFRRKDLDIDSLPAYLYTAVKFQVFNYVERHLAHRSFYDPFVNIALSTKDTDSSIIEKELYVLLESYINTLSEKKQKIFLLYFKENLSTKDIAERLNIPRKTVQNQLRTILLNLRTRIAPLLIMYISNHI